MAWDKEAETTGGPAVNKTAEEQSPIPRAEENLPLCPWCVAPLTEVGRAGHPSGFGVFFCKRCRKAIGVTEPQSLMDTDVFARDHGDRQ